MTASFILLSFRYINLKKNIINSHLFIAFTINIIPKQFYGEHCLNQWAAKNNIGGETLQIRTILNLFLSVCVCHRRKRLVIFKKKKKKNNRHIYVYYYYFIVKKIGLNKTFTINLIILLSSESKIKQKCVFHKCVE